MIKQTAGPINKTLLLISAAVLATTSCASRTGYEDVAPARGNTSQLTIPTPQNNSPTVDTASQRVTASQTLRQNVVVTRLIDGDTVEIDTGERVRLIGIDTPELGRNGKADECYALTAMDELADILPDNRHVTITLDVEPRDRYGRLLAWMWVGDTSVNVELVARGAAKAMAVLPNTLHIDQVEAAQHEAQSNSLGLWARC